ncbi:hypothetical protein [Streptomyces sp. NPDC050988]|uniref:hypothetical protein n=1 Tax=Streptomyces sp. NPDC050988 TaxID=3365637 RepID=UPI0037AFEEB9
MTDSAAPDDVHACVEQLRTALEENGITLPSLGIESTSFAAVYAAPHLVALGNCNLATAQALAIALRKAAAR